MAGNDDDRRAAVASETEAATPAKASRPMRAVLLLVLLGLTASYALFVSPIAPWPMLGRPLDSASSAAPSHPVDAREMPISLLEAPPRDSRLAIAVAEAAALRLRLASPNRPAEAQAIDLEDGHGNAYRAHLQLGSRRTTLALRSDADGAASNLAALRKAVDEIAPPPPAGAASGETGERAIPHGSRELLRGLAELDLRLARQPDAETLLRAAELYAWQGFFKAGIRASSVADPLAIQALAAYLAAGRADPFVEGLTWLALDLPAQAIAVLAPLTEHPRAQLLAAYVRRDLHGLRERAERGGEDAELRAYLLTRASTESGIGSDAGALMERFVSDYPDFASLVEYAAAAGIVGPSNAAMDRYPKDLIERHLAILGEIATEASLTADPDLVASARRGADEDDALEHWVKLHARLVALPLEPSTPGVLVDMRRLKDWLRLELQDALYYSVVFEATGLNRLRQADAVSQLIEAAWPGSPASRNALLWARTYDSEPEAAVRFRAGLSLAGADRRLLRDFVRLSRRESKAKTLPKRLDALEALRAHSDPGRADLLDLSEACSATHLHGCARAQLENAIGIAPYDYQVAAMAMALAVPPNGTDALLERVRHLPAVTYLEGKAAQKAGDLPRAESLLRQAMAASPGDARAYELLADMLIDAGRQAQAIGVMKSYLEHDHSTLQATRFRVSIGRLLTDAGDLDGAYTVLEEAAHSGAGYAMTGFARASERSGKPLQAEQFYVRAAKRYPKGQTPAKLAMFYLRQGNRDSALQVLRAYRRYNAPDYFVKPLAEHAQAVGSAALAIELAKEVSAQDWEGVRVRYFLANALLDLGESAAAAELYGSLALDVADPRKSAPYTYGPRYLKASEAARPGSSETLLEELMTLYAKTHPMVMEYFGVHLLMEDMPASAVPVLLERIGMAERRADVSLLMAALAWREAGGTDDLQRQAILSRLDGFDDEWLATRVRFLTAQIGEAELMAAAQGRSKLCEAHYFLGDIAARRGDRLAAEEHLSASLQTRASSYMQYQYAYDVLRKLDEMSTDG